MVAQELLIGSLDTIISQSQIPEVIIVYNVGNHGRFTKKYRYSNEAQTNFETIVYSNVIKQLQDFTDTRIQHVFTRSPIIEIEHLGQWLRFFHGHQVRYSDGVGGLTIPLNKKEAKWDQNKMCKFNFMCHYHQCYLPNSRTGLNGSLVGYNGYALFHGFRFEPPKQNYLVLEEGRDGFVDWMPIEIR